MIAFDFDQWATLAKRDQAAFEDCRQASINEAINDAISRGGNERRLRGLQSRIELERRRARTPLKACLRLSSLMWDSTFELTDSIQEYSKLNRCGVLPSAKAGVGYGLTNVIPFPHGK